jgi:hypothetical protein
MSFFPQFYIHGLRVLADGPSGAAKEIRIVIEPPTPKLMFGIR